MFPSVPRVSDAREGALRPALLCSFGVYLCMLFMMALRGGGSVNTWEGCRDQVAFLFSVGAEHSAFAFSLCCQGCSLPAGGRAGPWACFLCCIPYHKCLLRSSSKFGISWPKKLANRSIVNQNMFFLCMARWE